MEEIIKRQTSSCREFLYMELSVLEHLVLKYEEPFVDGSKNLHHGQETFYVWN